MPRDKIETIRAAAWGFNGMLPSRQQAIVCDLALAFLDAVETEHRALDAWETDCLLRALGAVQADWFDAAWVYVDMALTPRSRRSTGNDKTAVFGAGALARLREVFEETQVRNVQES